MSQPLLRLMMASVRVWTRLYTSGLPPEIREARRAEVESDLWESAHDPDPDTGAQLPLHITARLLAGIPDDLGWRLEQEDTMTRSLRLRVALTACLLALVGFWLVMASQAPDLPPRPDAPRPAGRAHVPPPPPPPPPPSPDGRTPGDVPVIYGDESYITVGSAATPTRIRHERAVYPPVAVWAGVEGTVALEATIDERGRVAEARVVEPAHWVLNQSALNAVRQWEFEPTMVDGVPVPIVITARVSFSRPR